MLSKNRRIGIVMGALVLFAAGSIMYFNGVLTPTNHTEPLNQIESNAGTPTESQAGPAVAQFKAECTLKSGQSYSGTVSVPSLQSPRDLEAVELKTTNEDIVRFAQADANCTYSPY